MTKKIKIVAGIAILLFGIAIINYKINFPTSASVTAYPGLYLITSPFGVDDDKRVAVKPASGEGDIFFTWKVKPGDIIKIEPYGTDAQIKKITSHDNREDVFSFNDDTITVKDTGCLVLWAHFSDGRKAPFILSSSW